jgi:LuxR family transcriptional regulator, maltose regulon positive regulatory protein
MQMLLETAAAPVPLTKFRVPRLRRDTVPRARVLARSLQPAREARLVLAQAPAGFGKTTLLVQLTAALAQGQPLDVVWVALDTEDDNANRLFAAICGALAPLELPWSMPPAAWLLQLQDAGPNARAALGPLLNALAGPLGRSIALVLDDLHHISDPGALALLDAFIDRLPPEVCLFVGSRITPPLSLARWRAAGELLQLGFEDLQFDADAAAALRTLRGLSEVSDEQLQAALARTHGWPAGLQLLLGHARERGSLPSLIGPAAHRHLFDYFAQEVLAELPASLQDFVLHCAVLPELNPALCQAVTGRDDAAFVLDGLYRRQLFLSALDEALPVLRFHDLFRDFLLRELEQRRPGLAPELHARAAAAEPLPLRAVQHLLAGRRWDTAVQYILRAAPTLLAEGAQETVQRWIHQLPEDLLTRHPELPELLGHCAWASYRYPEAEARLRLAAQGYQARGTSEDLLRLNGVLMLRARAFNGLGALDMAEQLLQACDGLPDDKRTRVALAGARCLLAGAVAPRTAFLPALQVLVEGVEDAVAQGRPDWLVPAINDLYNDFFYDLPGSRALWLRLRAACARAAAAGPVHWQVLMQASSVWPEFWHGERATLLAALDGHVTSCASLSHVSATWLDSFQTRELQALLAGDPALAAQRIERGVSAVLQPPLDSLAAGWKRPLQFRVAGMAWCAQDVDTLARLEADMQAPRQPAEWPFVEGGRHQVLGRLAILRGQLDRAEPLLRAAVAVHAHARLASQTGDPRVDLAWLLHLQGQAAPAWAALEAVWEECLQADGIGLWLLQPACVRQALLALMPPAWAARPGMAALLARLHDWASAPGQPQPATAVDEVAGADADAGADTRSAADLAPPGSVGGLSPREREVLAMLAEGQSNKHIARALDLSLHTVKRHVANILTKLALDSRTQAAAVWHRR